MENADSFFNVVRECGFITLCSSGRANFSLEDIEIQRIKERVTKWQSVLILNKIVSLEELLMSQIVQQEALTRLLVEMGDACQRGVFGDGEEPSDGNEHR